MAVVYTHIRLDSNEVFYVGIGVNKRRAYSKHSRNKHWYHIVNKHGYKVFITHDGLIWEEACSIEKYLISFYGRADLGHGCLVNMTDGGEGVVSGGNSGENNPFYGKRHNSKTVSVLSNKAKERYNTPEWKSFLSSVHKGKKLSQRELEFLSKRNTRGKNPRAKKVIDTSTGVIYDCVADAADALGYNYNTLRCFLNGGRKNNSSLRVYDK